MALCIGLGSLALAIAAPLAPDPARTVWITGFGAVAVWAGMMAIPRFRSVGRKPSALARTGIGLGIATIAIMVYAWVALATASAGVRLPAPAHWIADPTAVVSAPALPAVPAEASDAAALDPATDVEGERLALGPPSTCSITRHQPTGCGRLRLQ